MSDCGWLASEGSKEKQFCREHLKYMDGRVFPSGANEHQGDRYLKINLNALFPSVALYERESMENGPQEIRDL